MDYVQREKMRRACDKFVEQVDPVQLMPYLPSLNQCSREMVDAKRNQEGPFAAAQVLHGFLLKKPIFEELLAALRHPSVGMNHLADLIDAPAPDVSAGCCNTKLRPQATETVTTLSASSAASSRQPHLGTAKLCNVHNLDGGIKCEESGNLTDQSVFSEKTNDNAIGDTGDDYAADGCDQLAAQQGACGKENKNCFRCVVDTLKSKSLRKVVKAVEVTYNSFF